jgi:mono/diheme cytochrome c family protein
MPNHRLAYLVPALLVLLAAGCRESYRPERAGPPASSLSLGQYPLRTDLMVVGKTGLDGAPKHWNAPGFPPLLSAQSPGKSPDLDIADDVRKQLGKTVLDPAALEPPQTARLAQILEWTFGIPAEPRVRMLTWDEVVVKGLTRPDPQKGLFENLEAFAGSLGKWEDKEWKKWKETWKSAAQVQKDLKLDEATLERGSVLYRRNCLQCHGVSGAGDGAHAIELAAVPRDYRQGIFKFVTAFPPPGKKFNDLSPGGKPRREDLKRTIHNGLDGTMMPAFSTLSEQDLDDLASYVIHLSIRGETEFATMAKAMQPGDSDPDFNGPELDWLFLRNLLDVLNNWWLAARSPIPIPPDHTRTDDDRLLSAMRGYKYYHSAEFGCAACHINFGREPALKWDLWGTVVQPRNLPLGIYRGGRRGEDLYARLYGGIFPSGMPSFQNTLASGPSYPDRPDKIWNVVHFLQALSDPYQRADLKNPATLARFKERLKSEGDFFLDDLAAVKIDP